MFKRFLNRFFTGMEEIGVTAIDLEKDKQDYIHRITQVLNCLNYDDLKLDSEKVKKMPINSGQPIFLAAEVFESTLLDMGFNEDVAEKAKIAFYALNPKEEEGEVKDEFQEKIYRVA